MFQFEVSVHCLQGVQMSRRTQSQPRATAEEFKVTGHCPGGCVLRLLATSLPQDRESRSRRAEPRAGAAELPPQAAEKEQQRRWDGPAAQGWFGDAVKNPRT